MDGGGAHTGAKGTPLRVEQQEGPRLHEPASPSPASVGGVRRAVGLGERRPLCSHVRKVAGASAGERHLERSPGGLAVAGANASDEGVGKVVMVSELVVIVLDKRVAGNDC